MRQEKSKQSWRFLWAVLATAGAAWFAPVAQAASFDCAKASAKVEKAICADKELSSLDERMAAAYRKQLTAWQGEIADYVRYDQREFIKVLRGAHAGETEDQLECAKAYVRCVKKLLGERVAVLEAQAYPVSGVYQRAGAKLLLSVKDNAFDVLLFHKASNTIRATLKEEKPGAGTVLRKDASGYAASDLLVSKLGEGAVGDAMKEACEVRLRMSGRQAVVTQSGKCGADFAGSYLRLMKDRVENYASGID